MKKVCILSSVNIKHMTLISLYTNRLERDNIKYDIIYMDKYGENEKINAENIYRFENKITRTDSKLNKILKYFKFRKYAKQILNRNKYDFIIVWNEVTSFIFSGYLQRKYENRYCLNIRDYLYHDFPIIKNIHHRVINKSAFTTISSDAFKSFLPKYDYIHIHSLNVKLLSQVNPRKALRANEERLRISFIGNVRFFDINKKILDVFKNDNRFELCYFGTNSEVLKEYAINNEIENVSFNSSFPVEDTANFIEKSDIINNIYGNNSKKLDYALSIKLYYAIYNNLPILVNSKTHMAEIVSKYNIGYVVEKIDENLPNNIYTWYRSINFNDFSKNCRKMLDEIVENNIEFDRYYDKFIKL